MMASRYISRTREYRGIQPNSVAIRARIPLKQPADWLTQKNRAVDDHLRQLQVQVKEQQKRDLRTDFETNGERRILMKNVSNQVKTLNAANECNLECRREKLQNLLANEELCLVKELGEQEETVLERQAKMRERAKFLKDKRESERLAFVQEKYDQQFRGECEELRSILSKKHLEQVSLDRLDQLHQKEQTVVERKALDDMYARLWEQDMLEKAAREEREAKDLQERNRAMMEVLRKQMAALETQKEESQRLKEEEGQLMREQRALWKIDDELKLKEKIFRQNENRKLLDRSLASKMKKKAQEEQEQLAFDLKILEQLLKESHQEVTEAKLRKRELREEDQRYQVYLNKLIEEEKEREKELENVVQLQVEAAWDNRIEQWRKERVARQLLMNDVMEGRARQIKERLLDNEHRQVEAAREREELLCQFEASQRCETEEVAKRLENNIKYQRDLVDQITCNSQMREEERTLEQEQFRKAKQTEEEFQARKKQVLDNPLVEKVHPLRRALLAQVQNYL